MWLLNPDKNYEEMTDEELVMLAKKGDQEAYNHLINKYKNFIRSKTKSYFIMGAEKEDVIQEGLVGLYKAIRDYNPERKTSFKAFAELCITRQIITAIKTATRQKHLMLNTAISIDKPIYDDDSDRTLVDVIAISKVCDPEEIYMRMELSKDLKEKIKKTLSPLESQVLTAYLEGLSYQEMAERLGRHVKSIDNALQRIKRKIEKTFKEELGL